MTNDANPAPAAAAHPGQACHAAASGRREGPGADEGGGCLRQRGEGSLARYAIVCICRLCLRVNQATITIAAAHAEENLDQPRPLIMVYLTHCIMSGHLVTHPGYAKQTRSLGIPWNLSVKLNPDTGQAPVVTKPRWSLSTLPG